MGRSVGLIVLIAVAWSSPLWAERTAVAGPDLNELARSLVSDLAQYPEPRRDQLDLALVVEGPRTASSLFERTLSELLSSRLAKLGYRSTRRWSAQTEAQVQQHATSSGIDRVLSIKISVADGQLTIQAILLATDRLLWRDIAHPQRGALWVAHRRVALAAGWRWLLRSDQQSLALAIVDRRSVFDLWPLSAASADLDGDGRAELLVLFEHELRIFRRRRAVWQDVWRGELDGALASRRPRRALGTMVVETDRLGRPTIALRSSARARAARYLWRSGALSLVDRPSGYPLCLPQDNGSTTSLSVTRSGGTDLLSWTLAGAPQEFYAQGVAPVLSKTGQWFTVDASGELALWSPLASKAERSLVAIARYSKIGIAVALADLDGDQQLDVIASDATQPDEDDRLLALRQQGGQLKVVWRSAPLAGAIQAIACGPFAADARCVALVTDRFRRSRLVTFR